MTVSTQPSRRSESGFTLVELAIVMIIIGLLIGGILKGQELINNARVSAAATELKGMEGAVNTFRDKYSAMPGDISVAIATARVPQCTAVPCTFAGDGDGFIEANGNDIGAAQTGFSEMTAAYVQLSRAGMLAGNVDTATTTWAAGVYPDFELGGKTRLAYTTAANPTGNFGTALVPGHYLAVGFAHNAAMSGASSFDASSAATIDRKLDDGLANTGSIRGAGTSGTANTNCATDATVTGVYNEAIKGACGLFVKVLQ